jgi:hypothetical protein
VSFYRAIGGCGGEGETLINVTQPTLIVFHTWPSRIGPGNCNFVKKKYIYVGLLSCYGCFDFYKVRVCGSVCVSEIMVSVALRVSFSSSFKPEGRSTFCHGCL